MRADGVVDVFPVAEFAIEGFHFQRTGGDLVELFAVGGVGAFDGAVELGGARRQDEQVQCALLTSLFERGGELGAAVDLQGANGKGHAKLQGIGYARKWETLTADNLRRCWQQEPSRKPPC